jgi:hypothetical protein
MRTLALAGLLAAVLIGSFFLTSRLIDTGPSSSISDDRPDAERLASGNIFNRSDLIEAAIAVGLHSSSSMKGKVETVSRLNDHEVRINGWVADPDGDATPLTVLVFAKGHMAARIQTRGERSDVTRVHGLAFGAEKNVGFEVNFACPTGDNAVVVGLGQDKQYLYLPSPKCP